MTDKPPRHTRTTRHFTKPVGGREPEVKSQGRTSEDPTFVPRLTWKAVPKVPFDPGELCSAIDHADNVTFFCDNSVFDLRLPAALWPALTNRRGKVVIVPEVRQELEPWLQHYPDHPAAEAVRNGVPGVEMFDVDTLPPAWQAAATYYINLLAIRKRLVQSRIFEFERTRGRTPDDVERRGFNADIQRWVGERGFLLARKGASIPVGTAGAHTDEVLVYFAVARALASGRETIILTKDEDVQEQTYKMLWLLDTHYRAMLLAELYARDFSQFRIWNMPATDPRIAECFVGSSNVLIGRSEELINQLLPSSATVLVSCWVIGDGLSRLTFAADTEMARVPSIKGTTGGLNTDRLGLRNCRLWLAPLNIPTALRQSSAVVQDRRVPVGSTSVEIPLLDFDQAVFTGEHYTRLGAPLPMDPGRSGRSAPRG